MTVPGEIPSPDHYLDATFSEGGYLSRAFQGYRPRAGQVALAYAVDRAIVERTNLLSEAGCGVGKSVSYSVPATYHAVRDQRTVVIVTAAINLQEQLVNKDLPLLQRILPWKFSFALLKGRGHYLCADRIERHKQEAYAHRDLHLPTELDKMHLPIVRAWAEDCAVSGPPTWTPDGTQCLGGETGDKSELPFEPSHAVWKNFSVEADECKKSRCKHKARCFPNAAQGYARGARIIVTNYHMLYAHLQLVMDRGIHAILPPFGVCILDEAHAAGGIARDVFGFQITHEGIRRLANKITDEDPILADRVERASTWFFHAMLALKKDERRYKARLDGNFLNEEMQAWEALVLGVTEVHGLLARRVKTLQGELDEGPDTDLENEVGEAEVLALRGATLLQNLKAVANPELDERHAYYLDEDAKGRVAIAAKLVHPGDALRPGLFLQDADPEDADEGKITVVATSATLATGNGSFDFAAHELGIPDGYSTLLAASPFDWETQCLFVCPSTMPEPNAPSFRDAVAETMERIVRMTGGRTLGLFTSRRVLEHVHSALVAPCRKMGFTLLKQGDAPRTKLLDRFKTDITSVLLATRSFWAGVDVPGEALSAVVMDRLPFPSPDDPIAAALAVNDEKSFWHFNVPSAIIEFKQGAGRLIRSDACRGVVVCLDNRLLSKKYGKEFLRALPDGMPKTRRLEAIEEWFRPVPAESWED